MRVGLLALAAAAAGVSALDGEQGGVRPSSLESGVLAARWAPADPDCAHAPPFLVYEYNDTFIILRQSGCTHFEKPFLYLILGSAEALLVDTGDPRKIGRAHV